VPLSRMSLAKSILPLVSLSVLTLSALTVSVPVASAVAPVNIAPSPPAGSNFASSANGSFVAYNTNHGPDYNVAKSEVFVWSAGHVTRISTGLRAFEEEIAVAPNGSVVAFDALKHGHEGTIFYEVSTHRVSFVRGYMLGTFSYLEEADGNQMMDSTGDLVLLERPVPKNMIGGVYDRSTGTFTPLPDANAGGESEGLAISSNGEVVMYGERKPYAGEVARIVYNLKSHKRARLRESNDSSLHLLSSDGTTALTPSDVSDSPGGEFFPLYNYATGIESFVPLGVPSSVSMAGDGTTFGIACGVDLYTYSTTTKIYALLGTLPSDATWTLSNVAADGVLSEDGSEMVFNDYNAELRPIRGVGHAPAGLYEVSTAGATPVGTSLPAPCMQGGLGSLN
jgi:hypothetical protein